MGGIRYWEGGEKQIGYGGGERGGNQIWRGGGELRYMEGGNTVCLKGKEKLQYLRGEGGGTVFAVGGCTAVVVV